MATYTATQAAKALGLSPEYLRMKMREGEYRDIGEAIRPGKGKQHWYFPCYPAKVAQRTGKAITWDGVTYHPDGRTT